VEVCARVNDSVQPVHSWNDNQITEGRLAFSKALAMLGIMAGGNAIMDAVVAQNFMKLRRETPCLRNVSPKVPFSGEISVSDPFFRFKSFVMCQSP
jgi:hypothetical protein